MDEPERVEHGTPGIFRVSAVACHHLPRSRYRAGYVTPRCSETGQQCRSARLAGKMEALEAVASLDGVERRVHEVQFEQGFAKDMIARGPAETHSRQIDRRGLGHLGKRVRRLREIIGIDVPADSRIGWIKRNACVLVL